jgi:uncharacterized protein with von Willebrand factor type A (vWA) domain
MNIWAYTDEELLRMARNVNFASLSARDVQTLVDTLAERLASAIDGDAALDAEYQSEIDRLKDERKALQDGCRALEIKLAAKKEALKSFTDLELTFEKWFSTTIEQLRVFNETRAILAAQARRVGK